MRAMVRVCVHGLGESYGLCVTYGLGECVCDLEVRWSYGVCVCNVGIR